MGRRKAIVMPQTKRILEEMGQQIRLARLRRGLATDLVAQRAGISRATLCEVEKGSPSVAMGMYAVVLHALDGMDKDLLLVAKDDETGHLIQDIALDKKRMRR